MMMSVILLGAGGLRAHTASLFLAVAMLRLVIVPCLDARKTPARGPLYFYHGLLVRPVPERILERQALGREELCTVDGDHQNVLESHSELFR